MPLSEDIHFRYFNHFNRVFMLVLQFTISFINYEYLNSNYIILLFYNCPDVIFHKYHTMIIHVHVHIHTYVHIHMYMYITICKLGVSLFPKIHFLKIKMNLTSEYIDCFVWQNLLQINFMSWFYLNSHIFLL